MLERLIHEPRAREIERPLLTLSSLNKINLNFFLNLVWKFPDSEQTLRQKKTNISSESIDFHQRYEVSGCVTKKLLRIPRRGL